MATMAWCFTRRVTIFIQRVWWYTCRCILFVQKVRVFLLLFFYRTPPLLSEYAFNMQSCSLCMMFCIQLTAKDAPHVYLNRLSVKSFSPYNTQSIEKTWVAILFSSLCADNFKIEWRKAVEQPADWSHIRCRF